MRSAVDRWATPTDLVAPGGQVVPLSLAVGSSPLAVAAGMARVEIRQLGFRNTRATDAMAVFTQNDHLIHRRHLIVENETHSQR